ncbi:isoprenylcysteine carboxylmethyltransferase family protein [Luteimonas sp. 50]|uniref:Isoprenylcysteine carboxylmethyltransferase family protein n=1 Tax=Cognatiluteimonas sedimenti TaxID=2927791 RepID=A0ABT0A442_9GAMM|nr:isoprenylcysteine carboxylmethyltransferase family protein [Lysobacter sedimenti]MCJ0825730.1 isoprenylcysteine carboxylmethyltransferase family protein [Lysobacter sedimenti]
MDLPYDKIIKTIWLAFALCWLWYARQAKAVQRRESPGLRFAKYWLPLIAAGALLGPGEWYDAAGAWLKLRWLPESDWLRALGCLLALVGIAFAVRARQVLGENWSVAVQLKRGHELIERGPYRWVRHPIYTGLLLAFLGTAVLIGELRGLLALAIVAASFWFKLRLEERWLGEQFGPAYADYKTRVKALVPGLL